MEELLQKYLDTKKEIGELRAELEAVNKMNDRLSDKYEKIIDGYISENLLLLEALKEIASNKKLPSVYRSGEFSGKDWKRDSLYRRQIAIKTLANLPDRTAKLQELVEAAERYYKARNDRNLGLNLAREYGEAKAQFFEAVRAYKEVE